MHHDDGTLQALYDAEARDTAQAAVHRATPLSDLQHDLVTLAAGMAGDHPDSDVLATGMYQLIFVCYCCYLNHCCFSFLLLYCYYYY